MQRILVIGCGGAGKTTLARRLATALGLPLIELDLIYWRPGWIDTPMPEFRDAIVRHAGGPAWIMDGNYSSTFDRTMPASDTIVWLDVSRWVCMWGVSTRILRGYGRTRSGLPDNCPEHFDSEFLRYVWNFNTLSRPSIVTALETYARHAHIHRLESRKDAARFLTMIERR